MAFNNKKKIIPSSEYLILDIDETLEENIPHSKDPIKDMAKVYWKNDEEKQPVSTRMPNREDEDNKIYLNEDKRYITKGLSEESLKIFLYEEKEGKETIKLMVP